MKTNLFVITAALLISACGSPSTEDTEATGVQKTDTPFQTNAPAQKDLMKSKLVGKWTQPIPGQEPAVQGFELHPDQRASSINIHTQIYDTWNLSGDTLLLSSHSEGVKTSSATVDTFIIDELTDSGLALRSASAADTFRDRYQKTK